jgi:proline iminopeptidase
MLKVSETHTVYWEQSGNPEGKPAVFVHGGPGGGTNPSCRRFFNPEKYRIVLFDQRGCGKSTPHANLEDNTTWHLIEDMEAIREHLGIEKWLVFGGSWGSTLSLSYAIKHPERTSELVLRGIFMLRKKEIDWFYQSGASFIYPDAWESYLEPIPEEERHDLVAAFYKRLTSDDADTRMAAAKAWSFWEGSTSKLLPNPTFASKYAGDKFAEAFARIECHYFTNKGFFEEDGWILKNVDAIRHIPSVIVQGRYDVVCPATTAWELHRVWPEADFHMIADAGHNSGEPGIQAKLLDYTDKFAE